MTAHLNKVLNNYRFPTLERVATDPWKLIGSFAFSDICFICQTYNLEEGRLHNRLSLRNLLS